MILDEWWRGYHREGCPDREMLSDTGIVVEVKGEPTAMIFMYHTNSGICWAEFFTVNPKASKENKEKALSFLIECTKEWAKKANYELLYVSTNVKRYIKRLKDKEFVEADKNMSHCFFQVER